MQVLSAKVSSVRGIAVTTAVGIADLAGRCLPNGIEMIDVPPESAAQAATGTPER